MNDQWNKDFLSSCPAIRQRAKKDRHKLWDRLQQASEHDVTMREKGLAAIAILQAQGK